MNKHYFEIYFFNVKVLMGHQPLFFVGFLFLIEYNKLFQAFISDACVCSLSPFLLEHLERKTDIRKQTFTFGVLKLHSELNYHI